MSTIHNSEIPGVSIVALAFMGIITAGVMFWLPLFLYSWHWWFG